MDFTNYISVGISAIGLLGGALSWALNLKIKQDVLENNEKIRKEISDMKEKVDRDLTGKNDNLIRELGLLKDRLLDRIEHVDRDLTELRSNLADRILGIVNGKYVRTDIHDTTIAGIFERITSFRQLIEVSMAKIEQGLDRQIVDLKERMRKS